jgi:hypothetical protein
VTDLPAPEGQATPKMTSRPGKAKAALGRRGFVLAGAPFIMTLTNRPALAGGTTGGGDTVCTFSILASLNLSQPLEAGANCGVSPGCWKNKALNDGIWKAVGDPTDAPPNDVNSIINPPGNGEVGKWKWSNESASLYSALGSSPPKLGFRKTSGTTWYNSGNGVINEILAGYLNIMTFNNGLELFGTVMWGHYPISLAQFNAAKTTLFSVVPSSSGDVNTAVENFRNAIYLPGEGDHYCNAAF